MQIKYPNFGFIVYWWWLCPLPQGNEIFSCLFYLKFKLFEENSLKPSHDILEEKQNPKLIFNQGFQLID